MKRAFFVSIVIFLLIFFFSTSVYALTISDLDGSGAETGNIQRVGANVLTYVSIIASATSIVTLIILGIKYMLGSVEEKAQYKETLIPYVIGSFFVFGIVNIISIIYNIAKSL